MQALNSLVENIMQLDYARLKSDEIVQDIMGAEVRLQMAEFHVLFSSGTNQTITFKSNIHIYAKRTTE